MRSQAGNQEDDDTELDTIDDADHLAYVLTRRAKAAREMSVAGVLASVAHPAAYEHGSAFDIVIDPAFIDRLLEQPAHIRTPLIAELEPTFRAWLKGKDQAKRERAWFVLTRLLGPESDVVATGLDVPKKAGARVLRATLLGLKDARFLKLPTKLTPVLRRLLQAKEVARIEKELDEPGDICALLVGALARIDSPEAQAVLREAFEGDDVDLTQMVLPHIAATLEPAFVQARFAQCMATIAKSRHAGLPDRRALALGGALAQGMNGDPVMAKEVVAVLDLIPGPAKVGGDVGPFARLVANAINTLNAEELDRVAVQMTLPPKDRLIATAAAWIRLPVERAKAIATKFKEGDRATEDGRWFAIARAHLDWSGRRAEIQGLIPLKYLVQAIAFDPPRAPADVTNQILLAAVREARNPAELLVAVEAASMRGEKGLMRALLRRFRETPFKIDAGLEALLPPLIGPGDGDWIEQEIDGENPYRDRREALGRAYAKARSASQGG